MKLPGSATLIILPTDNASVASLAVFSPFLFSSQEKKSLFFLEVLKESMSIAIKDPFKLQ